MRFARKAPGGAVPLRDGDHAAPGASDDARRAKRRLNALGAASLLAEGGLVAVNAALDQRRSAGRPRAASCLAWAACDARDNIRPAPVPRLRASTMGFDQYHEPPEELAQETRTMAGCSPR